MKKIQKFLSFGLLAFFFVFSVSSLRADTACGVGAYCTGNTNYLRVISCAYSTGGFCYNQNIQNYAPHTCPIGGGPGSCIANAPGKDGCLGNTPIASSGSCTCTADFSSCTSNSDCSTLYGANSCSCPTNTTYDCGVPQDGPLGCCLAGPYCGDGTCNNGETSATCPSDCAAVNTCGNGVCAGGETCSSCPSDCGTCPAVCGNGAIEGGETCNNCPADVGVCPGGGAVCGNGIIESGETCDNCPADVGSCNNSGACTSCTASCSAPYCGQSDGCCGFCSDLDDRAAPAPDINSPSDGDIVQATLNGSNYEVTITITTQSNVNYNANDTYLDIYPEGTNCANALADCGVLVGTGAGYGTQLQYVYQIPAASYGTYASFQFRVYHQNNTCTNRIGTYSSWVTFTLGDTISGTVLRDDGIAGLSGGVCTSPFSPVAYTPQGGETITVTYNGTDYTTTLNADGTFSILAPISNSGENTVSFSTTNPPDSCGCPAGCSYSGIDSPDSGLTFYYQPKDIRDPWWQVIGGSVFAGVTSGQSVSSSIPVDTCLTSPCEPYLSLRDDNDETDSSGMVMTGGGNVDTANTSGYQSDSIDEDDRDIHAEGTSMDDLIENYAYFYRIYSMGLSPTNDINTPSDKPTAAPTNGRAHYRDGNLVIDNAWSLGATESIVVFVNGDLTVNNTISVPNGAFLAFIVNGNISFGSSVCQSDPDSTTAVVQGVFITDGAITVQSAGAGDCKFVGEGIFTAWNGFSLRRDFRDGGAGDFLNAQKPVEVFRYRPDFVVNIPERMTRPLYQWQEVAP